MVMTMGKIIKTYNELIQLPTFEDRFRYLRIGGAVGESTFGFERYLNQRFYHSDEWKALRRDVIIRDMGLDLACEDHDISGLIIVHHMNPISVEDLSDSTEFLLNPKYLICVSDLTHKAIHYGDESLLPKGLVERRPGDTKLW